MIREPAVAGYFYPEQKEKLTGMLDGFREKAPVDVLMVPAKGAVLPHAGYVYSGLTAAKTVFSSGFRRTFIILSPNHTGAGEVFSVMENGTWRMPLGPVEIDQGLAGRLIKNSRYLKSDFFAHRMEHGVEVLLPFLQYVDPGFQFVPIVLAHAPGETYKRIAREIAEVLNDYDKARDVTILASSDMTHFEPQASAQKKDRYAIEAMCAMDSDGLLKKVSQYDISMCGVGPAVVMMEVLKKFGAVRSRLIDYRTSAEATGEYLSVVGYAGLRVE